MSGKGKSAPPPAVPAKPAGQTDRDTCRACGGTGHYARDCLTPGKISDPKAGAASGGGFYFADKNGKEIPEARTAGMGKGHRQKGAGTVQVGKDSVTIQGITMKEWQRTPQTLLLELCKRDKRPVPRYDQLSGRGDGVRFRCVLQDAKRPGTDKDLLFAPDTGFEEAEDAKHTVALLALHSLEGDRQHEMKLPEPYRTLWLTLKGQAPSASAAAAPAAGADGADVSASGGKWKGKPKAGAGGVGGGAPLASAASGPAVAASAPAAAPVEPGGGGGAVGAASSANPHTALAALPVGPVTAAGSGNAAAQPPPMPAVQVKRVPVVPLEVRLVSKHTSAEAQRRSRLEKEARRREMANKRESRLREQLARQREGGMLSMTSAVREYIEGVVRTCSLGMGGANAVDDSLDDEELDDDGRLARLLSRLRFPAGSLSSIVAELTELGFSAKQASVGAEEGARMVAGDAADTCIASGRHVDSSIATGLGEEDVLSSALDWLCLNVAEEDLPAAFDPRGKAAELKKVAASVFGQALPGGLPAAHGLAPDECVGGAKVLCAAAPCPPLFPLYLPPPGHAGECVHRSAAKTSLGNDERAAVVVWSTTVCDELEQQHGLAPRDAALCTALAASLLMYAGAETVRLHAQALLLGVAELVACCELYAALGGTALRCLVKECAPYTAEKRQAQGRSALTFDTEDGASLQLRAGPLMSVLPPSSTVTCDDPILACAQEIEASGSIYGADFSVRSTRISTDLAVQLLVGPEGCGSDDDRAVARRASWAFRTLRLHTSLTVSPSHLEGYIPPKVSNLSAAALSLSSVKLNTPFLPPLVIPCTLYLTYLACDGEGDDESQNATNGQWGDGSRVTTDAAMAVSSSIALSATLSRLLYPNTLPVFRLSAGPRATPTTPTLSPTHCAHLSAHTLAHLIKEAASRSAGEASPLLFELNSWLSGGGGVHAGELCWSSPRVAVRNRRPDLTEEDLEGEEREKQDQAGGAGRSESGLCEEGSGGAANGSGIGAVRPIASGRRAPASRSREAGWKGEGPAQGPPRMGAAMLASMKRDSEAWQAAVIARARDGEWQRMQAVRQKLPMAKFRQQLIDAVSRSQVVLLSGETGCGKTTQMPQFILEDAIARGRGGFTRIVCTQPRRIAAIGVAQRVAAERCEPLGTPGGAAGYQIRGERKAHAGTTLLFTTTGVLLRRLTSPQGLGHVTHVLVDEVHERAVDTDFLLAVLRILLPARPDVKLVLMSATMDAASFAKYFESLVARAGGRGMGKSKGTSALTVPASWEEEEATRVPTEGVPILSVPGFIHPITEVHLEEVLLWTGYTPRMANAKGGRGGATPSATAAGALKAGADSPSASIADTAASAEAEANGVEEGLSLSAIPGMPSDKDLRGWKSHGLDYGLVSALLHKLCANGGSGPLAKDPDGSILVFLPGSIEIRRLHRELERGPHLGAMHVLHLHGGLSAEEQSLVFKRAPYGKRKVVISTNVAETSITIDDCTVVIDTFRVKESQYDALNRMSKLVETWTSLAASRQRRGRAGRVRPGTCYRLVPLPMLANLAAQSVPEIQRTPLDSLCLQIKMLRLGPIALFMRSLLDPPPVAAVKAALENLSELGALQPNHSQPSYGQGQDAGVDYDLTPLGFHLASLPLDVSLAKALIFGALLRCIDPLLTIAAALSERSPFRPVTPATDDDTRAAIEKGRAVFAWGQSDHLAVVRAYNAWRETGMHGTSSRGSDGREGGSKVWAARRAMCAAHGLSHETLRAMSDLRIDFAATLTDLGFLPGSRGGGGRGTGVRGQGGDSAEYEDEEGGPSFGAGATPGSGSGPWGRHGELSAAVNVCSLDVNVVRAALVAGLYPKVAKVVPPPRRYHETVGGAVPTDYKPEDLRFYTLAEAEEEGSVIPMRGKGGVRARGGGKGGVGLRVGSGCKGSGGPGRDGVVGGGGRKQGGVKALASAGQEEGGSGDSEDDASSSEGDEGEKPDVPAPRQPGSAVGGPARMLMTHSGFTQERVFIHPGSFLFTVGEYRCPWVVYHEKAATSKVFLRDSTVVTPFAMALFGGPLTVHHRQARLAVGDKEWVSFHSEPRIGVLAKALRKALSRLLAAKIEDPGMDLTGSPVIEAILRLLRGNGF